MENSQREVIGGSSIARATMPVRRLLVRLKTVIASSGIVDATQNKIQRQDAA